MTVKMWPVLPKNDEANGLTRLESALNADPTETHVVVAVINRRRGTDDDDTGETIPTARIVHIEALTDTDAAKAGRDLLAAACKTRTGATTLPFESDDAGDDDDD